MVPRHEPPHRTTLTVPLSPAPHRRVDWDQKSFKLVRMAEDHSREILSLDARLVLARQAVRDFSASCFWNWKKDAVINEAALPEVAAQLRMHGGRKGFLLAAQLCPSPQSRKRFFDFSANTATRRAT